MFRDVCCCSIVYENEVSDSLQVPKTPQSFADHLNATLRNMGSNVVTPLVGKLALAKDSVDQRSNRTYIETRLPTL